MPDETPPLLDGDLRRRILLTLGALAVFRLGLAIPLPGISVDALRAVLADPLSSPLRLLFSGGALGGLSVLALGVLPLLAADAVLRLAQLAGVGTPARRGAWLRGLTLAFALFEAACASLALAHAPPIGVAAVVARPDPAFYVIAIATLAAGGMFAAWLADWISESGVGSGAALLVFTGVAGRLTSSVWRLTLHVRREEVGLFAALTLTALVLVVAAAIVAVETAQRRVTVQYAKRIVNRRMMGGNSTALPLKADPAGVAAAILALAVLALLPRPLPPLLGDAVCAALIAALCLAGSRSAKADELAENLKKAGGFLAGLRAGEPTAARLRQILRRLSLEGAVFAAAFVVLPDVLRRALHLPFLFNGAVLLIAVGVALDSISQVETRRMMRRYESVLRQQERRGR